MHDEVVSHEQDASASLRTLVRSLVRLEVIARTSPNGESEKDQASVLAELQRTSGWALRAAVARARQRGVSWRQLAVTLDMPAMTLHRQFNSGHGVFAIGQHRGGPPPTETNTETGDRQANAAGQGTFADAPATSTGAPPRQQDGDPPAVLDQLVGRERELADLRPLLAKNRLITLTGPGGVGKTRLALECLAKIRASYGGGVRWVNLGPLSDGSLVAPTVASAVLGGSIPTGSVEEAVADGCGSRSALIVLDNCEHVIESCAELVEPLLERCPRLSVLATSREALQITGETVFPVTPLPVPGSGRGTVARSGAAVQLFVHRARSVQPSFTLTDTMAETVATVCMRLDGIPLAIELAARQTAFLSPTRLLEDADRRLDLLVGGLRTAPHRHQSLRSAISWSYDLLDAEQQQVFRRMSVLPGGFEEPLATALCAGLGLSGHRVWSLLTALADKSLLVSDQAATGRFRMLESLRVFGGECLEAADETEEVHERLLAWMADFSERLLLWTSNPAVDLAGQLDRERHNLHYAVTTAERLGDPRTPLLGAALTSCWNRRGVPRQGERLAERLLAAHPSPSVGRACLSTMLSEALCRRGHHADAVAPAEEALSIAQTREHPTLIVRALGALSRARSCLGEHDVALGIYQRQVELLRTLEQPTLLAMILNRLAWKLLMIGRADEATGHIEEALSLLDSDNAPEALGATLHTAAGVSITRQRFEEAAQYFTMALAMHSVDAEGKLYNLEGLALVAMTDGQPERGLRLLSTAKTIREKSHLVADAWWKDMVQTAADRARQDLPPARAAAALADGAGLSHDEAIRYALHNAWPLGRCDHPDSVLTSRQWQVAELVAQGLTNQQIAARLHISPRTAASHLEAVKIRLNLQTRAHVVTWVAATEHTRKE